MKNVFSVFDGGFDKGQPRIGFAALKGPSAQTVATTQGAVNFNGEQTLGAPPGALSTQSTTSSFPTQPLQPAPTMSISGMVGGSGLPAPFPGSVVPLATLSLIAATNVGTTTNQPRAEPNSASSSLCSSFVFFVVGLAAGLANSL